MLSRRCACPAPSSSYPREPPSPLDCRLSPYTVNPTFRVSFAREGRGMRFQEGRAEERARAVGSALGPRSSASNAARRAILRVRYPRTIDDTRDPAPHRRWIYSRSRAWVSQSVCPYKAVGSLFFLVGQIQRFKVAKFSDGRCPPFCFIVVCPLVGCLMLQQHESEVRAGVRCRAADLGGEGEAGRDPECGGRDNGARAQGMAVAVQARP